MKWWMVGAMMVAAALACGEPAPIAGPTTQARTAADGTYIVVFRDGVADVPGLARALARAYGSEPRFIYERLRGFATRLPPQAVTALQHSPAVAYLEPDVLVQVQEVQQPTPAWNLDRVDQRFLPLDNRYTYVATGVGVNVYVIDTGIRLTHTDFGGRALGTLTFVNDGNGASDCFGHGTRVAGLIGGAVHGVAKQATLHSIRVGDCNGLAPLTLIVAALDWITQNRVAPAVVNLSLGGGFSQAWNDAVQRAIDAGVAVVVAAGNSSVDACTSSPASAPQALTTGATFILGKKSAWSNFGPCLDLFAPGENVKTTKVFSDTATGLSSGTSMAAPQVTGAAALYLQNHPAATPAEVNQGVLAAATSGVLSDIGVGSPNLLLYTLVGGVPPPPDMPPVASFTASCPARGPTCNFDASASNDDVGIVDYAWTFGDGINTVSASPTISHTYATKGTYLVTLTVTDTAGQTSQTTRTVVIKRL